MRPECRLVVISTLVMGALVAAAGTAFAATPLDNTHWQNQSCHFQDIYFLTTDAPVTPVNLYFQGDDFGWGESFSVSGSTVRIYKSSFDREIDTRSDSFTGTFDATNLSGTHAWTDEGGSHTEDCSYTAVKRTPPSRQ